MINLPVQVAPGFPLRVRGAGDASGGYSVVKFETLHEARVFMQMNSTAEMPAWKRFECIQGQIGGGKCRCDVCLDKRFAAGALTPSALW